MATDLPLGTVANPFYRAAAEVLFSDVALYHNEGAMGNWGYFGLHRWINVLLKGMALAMPQESRRKGGFSR